MLQKTDQTFIITIGASAGGLNAIGEVVAQLPEDLNAAVFIVIHLSKVGLGEFLVHRIQKYTPFTCIIAKGGEKIKPGYIYLAPPNQHLLMNGDEVLLGHGPTENRWRPSIDALFRSAAIHYGNRVIGIILTGYLNDGAAGMETIKQSGGFCIVQDPKQAEYPDMPLAVLDNVQVDYCVRLAEMGDAILEIVNKAVPKRTNINGELAREAEITEQVITNVDAVQDIGDRVFFACPDCGGGLYLLKNSHQKRYRCHIGHSYSENDLLARQSENLESTLWVALRIMEERKGLLLRLSSEESRKGLEKLSALHLEQATELERHVDNLKKVLFATQGK